MRELFLGFYFFLLFYVAFYGIHLYWLIALHRRHRDRAIATPPLPAELPKVTVQLPIYNERLVAKRLIDCVAALYWPRDKLEIQVIDDSDDETVAIVAATVERLQAGGLRINHLRRARREGFKAGALAHGLQTASGEFIAIFDADNLPQSDFLKQIIPHFAEPRLGLVQARWGFANRDESLLCRAQALFLDAHFLVEQFARSRGELFMNFNGTAGVWRRETIEAAGGWRADTLTEDLDLSYRAQLAGWRMLFLDEVVVPTELPASIRSFKTQQYRWSRGAVETGLKVLPRLLRSALPLRVKLGAFFHLTKKSVSLALLLLSLLLVPALYLRLESGIWKLMLIDIPIFLLGTGSMSLFYGIAHRRQRTSTNWRDSLLLPVLTSLGIALGVNNSRAILAALRGRAVEFVRTPKAGVRRGRSGEIPNEYRIGFDHTVQVESFLALYALTALVCAIWLGVYPSIPFLLTFAGGFGYFAGRSLWEAHV